MKGLKAAALALLLALVAGCAVPVVQPPGPGQSAEAIATDGFVMADGWQLPFRTWAAAPERERAVIIALHGFNDYSFAWDMPGPWWASEGVTTYAYDQRGFGKGAMRGIWPGEGRLAADLRAVTRLVAAKHRGKPVFVIGESMGGAVVMAAVVGQSDSDDMPLSGVVLAAPAVWGRASMNWFMQGTLWFFAHTMPGQKFTGRDLGIRASDNIEMLRALGRDPLFIKETRTDAIWGIVNLMDAATEAAPVMEGVPILLLYGAKDEVIPARPVARMLDAMTSPFRLAHYPDGWHLLFRDLQREVVWRDVLAWIDNQGAPLPSGFERHDRRISKDAAR